MGNSIVNIESVNKSGKNALDCTLSYQALTQELTMAQCVCEKQYHIEKPWPVFTKLF